MGTVGLVYGYLYDTFQYGSDRVGIRNVSGTVRYGYFTGTVLVLYWYGTGTLLVRYWYFTGTVRYGFATVRYG